MNSSIKYSIFFLIILYSVASYTTLWAWMSGPEPFPPGPERARLILEPVPSTPPNEHAQLLEHAMRWAGLPEGLISGAFKLKVYIDKNSKVEGSDLDSWMPVSFLNANSNTWRWFTIPGFAALPDHSYALWDWAESNETCPNGTALNEGTTAQECHNFTSHMGAVNSNHFPPQAGENYKWYHKLATDRAAECKTLADQLMGNEPYGSDSEYTDYAQASIKSCEREALSIEAVGQHFLQDTWAIGHMWERWGSTDLNDFPGDSPTRKRTRALLVAAVSGLIHGAEPLFLDYGLNIPDDMSTGLSEKVSWGYADSEVRHRGVGDLNAYKLGILDDITQGSALTGCSAAGIWEVYNATAMVSGDVSDPVRPDIDIWDPTGNECIKQRATNAAIERGFALDLDPPRLGYDRLEFDTPIEIEVPILDGVSGEQVIEPFEVTTIAQIIPIILPLSVDTDLETEFRINLARLKIRTKLLAKSDPNGFFLANHGIASHFLGVKRNGAEDYEKTPPAPYSDPSLPWPNTPGNAANARSLARTFHKAHLTDWCSDPEANPENLKQRVQDVVGTENENIAKEICQELSIRHVRQNDKASMCETVGQGGWSFDGNGDDLESSAEKYCEAVFDYRLEIRNTSYIPCEEKFLGDLPCVYMTPSISDITVQNNDTGKILFETTGFDISEDPIVIPIKLSRDAELGDTINVIIKPYQQRVWFDYTPPAEPGGECWYRTCRQVDGAFRPWVLLYNQGDEWAFAGGQASSRFSCWYINKKFECGEVTSPSDGKWEWTFVLGSEVL